MSSSERFMCPLSSGKMRNCAVFSAYQAASFGVSAGSTPTSASRPRSMRPTTSPDTRTSARLTRCKSTFMEKAGLLGLLCDHEVLDLGVGRLRHDLLGEELVLLGVGA